MELLIQEEATFKDQAQQQIEPLRQAERQVVLTELLLQAEQ